jgi:asparagine synthase (glutamine-hydrolysing)
MSAIYSFVDTDGCRTPELLLDTAVTRMSLLSKSRIRKFTCQNVGLVLMQTAAGEWHQESCHHRGHLVSVKEHDDAYVVSLDGTIDNLSEVIAELGLANSAGRLNGAAVILAAYKQWGLEAFGKFVGDFAMVIWDGRSKRLVCARDPVGVRPLYYCSSEFSVAVASQIRPLLPMDGAPRLDMEYLAEYVVSGLSLTRLTPFQGVFRLMPGEALIIESGHLRRSRYWDFSLEKLPSTDNAVDHFRALFFEAVRCRVVAGYPAWSELSGGMDSSSIVCVAQKVLQQVGRGPISTLTAVFPDAQLSDEHYWSQILIDAVRPNAHILPGDVHHPFQAVQEAAHYWDEPSIQIAFFSLYRQYVEVMSKYRGNVLLSGIGAESAIMDKRNDPIHLADLLRSGHLLRLRRELIQWQRVFELPISNLFLECCLKPLIHPDRVEYGSVKYRVPKYVNSKFAQSWELGRRAMRGQRARKFRSPADQWQYEKIGRISAFLYRGYLQQFCTIRYPFLDRRILEFAMATRWDKKLSPGVWKPLLFLSMQGILPEEIRSRRINSSTGHAIYLGIRKAWRSTEELTRKPLLADLGIVEPCSFTLALQLARTGHAEDLHVLASNLALEAWLRAAMAGAHAERSPELDANLVG